MTTLPPMENGSRRRNCARHPAHTQHDRPWCWSRDDRPWRRRSREPEREIPLYRRRDLVRLVRCDRRVRGRLCGRPARRQAEGIDGRMARTHGLGAYNAPDLYLLTSTVGSLLGGAYNTVTSA